MPRRSYDQYCPIARSLDVAGERWTLLIVRELLAGPRRYTDLHADLPGVSTDVLAGRLKDMEREGLVTRRRLPRPGPPTSTNSPAAAASCSPYSRPSPSGAPPRSANPARPTPSGSTGTRRARRYPRPRDRVTP